MKNSRWPYILTILCLTVFGLIFLSSLTAQAAVAWTPQTGWYQKQISSAGKVRYVLTALPIAPPAARIEPCLKSAKFKCDADWGVVFNLDAAVANQCNRLQINKADLSDAALFSGMRVVNGEAVCP